MGPNRPLSRHGDSDAPIAAEVHSFVRRKLSAKRPSVCVKSVPFEEDSWLRGLRCLGVSSRCLSLSGSVAVTPS
jgi:hypothetical protein